MHKLLSVKSFFVILLLAFVLSAVYSPSAKADSIIPMEIEPICSDVSAGLAHWKVTNKNPANVNVAWTNLYNNVTGNYNATPGVSEMLTSYVASDPNNTTSFTSGPDTNQTNATKAACNPVVTPPNPPVIDCVDGNIQQNLIVTFTTKNTVNIKTAGNKPVCSDVEIYFSSYIMPDNYDGNGFFGNPTALPQTHFASVHTTLLKNTVIDTNLTVNLPPTCKNTQVDVYYGPEQINLGPAGHGTSNIVSQVYLSTGVCGGMGGGTQPETPPTPVTPTTPPTTGGGMGSGGVVALANPADLSTNRTPAVAQPSELPKTGSNLLSLLMTLPFLVAIASYFVSYEFQMMRTRQQ